jgi:acetyl-CoA acyltransferase
LATPASRFAEIFARPAATSSGRTSKGAAWSRPRRTRGRCRGPWCRRRSPREAVRTPIGRFQGGLSGVRPDDLAAIALRAALARSGVDGAAIDEVVLGCANQAGEDNRNVARMALLLAGLPDTVPGFTVNRLCASGLEAIASAARLVRCGDARLVLAGGVESMSRAPYSVPRGPQHPKAGNLVQWDTSLGWRYPNPAMERIFPLESMGETAENIADDLGISRADQDAFAVRSHQRAVAAGTPAPSPPSSPPSSPAAADRRSR